MCIQGLSGNLREEEYFEVLDIDGKIRLKWLLKKYDLGGGRYELI